MAGQYWTKKGDQDDLDEKVAKPFAELVSHGNMFYPDPTQEKETCDKTDKSPTES